jgi:mono/diheme cytochrome c family protein
MAERPLHALVAEFDDAAAVARAARAVRDAGYRRFDVFSPYPIHGIERDMGLRPTHLPWIVLGLGLTGTACALLLQWWTNGVDYPFRISGKPLFGLPAAIPITFELSVLLAAFAAFFGMLGLNRLPLHHHPLFEHPRFRRATDDGFFLAVEAGDAQFDARRTRELLQGLTRHPVEACHETAGDSRLPGWLRAGLLGLAALALVPLAGVVAARSLDSAEPPLHLVKDMDSQPRYRAQVANPVFADGRAMRPDVEGTVAFGELGADGVLATGRRGEQFSAEIPLPVTADLMRRGAERFGIFCAPCHGAAGYGDGLVAQRAKDLQEPTWVPPASLHDKVVRERAVGQIFDTIRNGVRTMPAYGRQMPVEDSWAIVAYVRALQRSQNATVEDVPASERAALGVR